MFSACSSSLRPLPHHTPGLPASPQLCQPPNLSFTALTTSNCVCVCVMSHYARLQMPGPSRRSAVYILSSVLWSGVGTQQDSMNLTECMSGWRPGTQCRSCGGRAGLEGLWTRRERQEPGAESNKNRMGSQTREDRPFQSTGSKLHRNPRAEHTELVSLMGEKTKATRRV